jgi:hypothetical protein
MSWAAVDDRLHADPRRFKAGLEAMGLWAMGRSWIAGELTDGHVPAEAALSLSGGRQEAIDRLVEVGFWAPAEGGYTDVDYLRQNLPRAEILARKAARAASGAKGGAISVDVRRQQHGTAIPLNARNATEAPTEATTEASASKPPKHPPKQVTEATTEPPDPGPKTPSFADAKAPYPRADAREGLPIAHAIKDEGTGPDVASDGDGNDVGAVQLDEKGKAFLASMAEGQDAATA